MGAGGLHVDLADVDPRFIEMLLTYEDRRFRDHPGVDWRSMLRASAQAVWNGRIVSGGSTLSMQVARLLEEGTTGEVGGKLRQMRVALALERRLTKDQILSLYLHLAPYGGNLEGVRAASLSYFGKEPGRLTPAESALLVAIPQSPETRRPDRAADRAEAARNRVLARAVTLRSDRPRRGDRRPDRRRCPACANPFPPMRRIWPTAPAPKTRWRGTHHLTLDLSLQKELEALAAEAVQGRSDRVAGGDCGGRSCARARSLPRSARPRSAMTGGRGLST